MLTREQLEAKFKEIYGVLPRKGEFCNECGVRL